MKLSKVLLIMLLALVGGLVIVGGCAYSGFNKAVLCLLSAQMFAQDQTSAIGTAVTAHEIVRETSTEVMKVVAAAREYAEAERIRRGIPGYSVTHAWEMQGEDWIERALSGVEGRPVYLTVDLDYFDPAILPATGTPEPGGGQWWPTLRLLEALFERTSVVASDVVELAPIPGLHHADFTAARLVHKLIGLAVAGR